MAIATEKNKIRKILLAYKNFRQTIIKLGGEQRQLIEKLNKKLDQSRIEEILKKLKQK